MSERRQLSYLVSEDLLVSLKWPEESMGTWNLYAEILRKLSKVAFVRTDRDDKAPFIHGEKLSHM